MSTDVQQATDSVLCAMCNDSRIRANQPASQQCPSVPHGADAPVWFQFTITETEFNRRIGQRRRKRGKTAKNVNENALRKLTMPKFSQPLQIQPVGYNDTFQVSIGKKTASRPCCQDCWHTGLIGSNPRRVKGQRGWAPLRSMRKSTSLRIPHKNYSPPLSATFIWTCRFNLLHTAITFHHFFIVLLWA